MTVRLNGHTTGCKCNVCIWELTQVDEPVRRFANFTDIEIGHIYAVLKPGRMLAEVTAEIERRQRYYKEEMPCEHGYSDYNNCGKCRTPQETP